MLAAYLGATLLFPKPDGRIVFGDATHHFVQLRSLVFDHDLDFRDEYVRIYHLHGNEPGTEWVFSELTPTGHVRNYMPVGPALLWAPLYLLVAAGTFLLHALGLAAAPDGYGRPFQLVPGITGIAVATIGAIATWRLVRRRTNDASAAVAVVGVWLGSHALYYSVVSPSYSHAASIFASSLFFLRWFDTRERPSLGRFAEWGALVGLAALMRWQDAIFGIVPLIEAARWRAPAGRRVAAAGLTGLTAAAVFSPQMVVWTVLYGHPLALPQGASFMRWFSPHLLAVLFSDSHGLFIWAPLLVPATLGLVTFLRRDRAVALPVASVVLATWYVNAAVADWWAGEAFGARRFLSLFPLFALGLAVWLQADGRSSRARAWRLVAVAVLTAANGLLLLQYELFMKGLRDIAPYPHGWVDMWLVRLVVPFRLLRWWVR